MSYQRTIATLTTNFVNQLETALQEVVRQTIVTAISSVSLTSAAPTARPKAKRQRRTTRRNVTKTPSLAKTLAKQPAFQSIIETAPNVPVVTSATALKEGEDGIVVGPDGRFELKVNGRTYRASRRRDLNRYLDRFAPGVALN